jgi:hypothetical protein
MDKIIASFSFDEPAPENIQDLDILSAMQQKKEGAVRNISSVIQSVQGRVVGWTGKHLIAELDIDHAQTLKELHNRLNKELNMPTSIGVGETVDQAITALTEAEKLHTLKVWHPSMESESTVEVNPQHVAVGEETEAVHKSEDDMSDDAKGQIAVIIKTLRENKDYLTQLQQSNPDAYQAIVEIVQALTAVSGKAKEKAAKQKDNDVKKIIKLVESAHEDELNEEEKQLIEAVLKEQETRQKNEMERMKHASKARRDEKKALEKRVSKTAKKHNLEPSFLAGVMKIK